MLKICKLFRKNLTLHSEQMSPYLRSYASFLLATIKFHFTIDLSYFTYYFRLVEGTSGGDAASRLLLRTVQAELLLEGLYFAALLYFNPNLSPLERILAYDGLALERVSPINYVWLVLAYLISVYFLQLLFVHNTGFSKAIVYSLLVEGSNQYMIYPNLGSLGAERRSLLLTKSFPPRTTFSEYSRVVAVKVRNFCKLSILLCGNLFVFIYLYLIN